MLEEGSAVPADLRLCSVAQLAIIETLLTSESVPVEKTIDSIQVTLPTYLPAHLFTHLPNHLPTSTYLLTYQRIFYFPTFLYRITNGSILVIDTTWPFNPLSSVGVGG